MSGVFLKVGDRVYCPRYTSRILKVVYSQSSPSKMAIEFGNKLIDTTKDGRFLENQGLVNDIFPATQEWHKRLSDLYLGVFFEQPPKRKEPKEIIKAMFGSNKWYLVNYVVYGNLNQKPKNKTITKRQFLSMNYDEYFNRYAYCNVEIIDPNTGKTIIDFVDGKIVLECENGD